MRNLVRSLLEWFTPRCWNGLVCFLKTHWKIIWNISTKLRSNVIFGQIWNPRCRDAFNSDSSCRIVNVIHLRIEIISSEIVNHKCLMHFSWRAYKNFCFSEGQNILGFNLRNFGRKTHGNENAQYVDQLLRRTAGYIHFVRSVCVGLALCMCISVCVSLSLFLCARLCVCVYSRFLCEISLCEGERRSLGKRWWDGLSRRCSADHTDTHKQRHTHRQTIQLYTHTHTH